MLTADELEAFIATKMRMSHIYQPLLIRTLIESGGTVTLRQAALAFLERDESQIRFYEDRIKQMPLRVLRQHTVVSRVGDSIVLNVGRLSYEEMAQLVALCEQRVASFLKARGMATWDYRLLETDPVPTDVRYRVLAAAKGRCSLCGVTSKERRIEVDHIVPRSRGGSNKITNLQALCDVCNRGKSNKDTQRF